MSVALQDVIDQAREASNPAAAPLSAASSSQRMNPLELLETRRGDMPQMVPPPVPHYSPVPGSGPHVGPASPPSPLGLRIATPGHGIPKVSVVVPPTSPPAYPINSGYPQMQMSNIDTDTVRSNPTTKWIWWIVGLLALGATAGAVLALLTRS